MGEADLGIVPGEAADEIAARATLDQLDLDRVRELTATLSHPLMPLIVELTEVVGDPHGQWIHWGATTQNLTQTGDLLVIRRHTGGCSACSAGYSRRPGTWPSAAPTWPRPAAPTASTRSRSPSVSRSRSGSTNGSGTWTGCTSRSPGCSRP